MKKDKTPRKRYTSAKVTLRHYRNSRRRCVNEALRVDPINLTYDGTDKRNKITHLSFYDSPFVMECLVHGEFLTSRAEITVRIQNPHRNPSQCPGCRTEGYESDGKNVKSSSNISVIHQSTDLIIELEADPARLHDEYEALTPQHKRRIRLGAKKSKYMHRIPHILSMDQELQLICQIHGTFIQTKQVHTSAVGGCMQCILPDFNAQYEFIQQSKALFGSETFDYSRVLYIDDQTEVILGTNTCWHPPTLVTPSEHLNGKGCNCCAVQYRAMAERRFGKKQSTALRFSYAERPYIPAYVYLMVVTRQEKGPVEAGKWLCVVAHHALYRNDTPPTVMDFGELYDAELLSKTHMTVEFAWATMNTILDTLPIYPARLSVGHKRPYYFHYKDLPEIEKLIAKNCYW